MMRLARMLIGKGSMDGVRILSEASVAAMGTDQTVGTFNPGAERDHALRPGVGLGQRPGPRGGGDTRLDQERRHDSLRDASGGAAR